MEHQMVRQWRHQLDLAKNDPSAKNQPFSQHEHHRKKEQSRSHFRQNEGVVSQLVRLCAENLSLPERLLQNTTLFCGI